MPIMLIGTAEECIRELQRRERDWGLGHYVISARATGGMMERFAAEIAPKV
jgi:hypothetical protein